MKQKKHYGYILKLTIASVLAFVFIVGCSKYESTSTDSTQNYEELKSKFFNTNSTTDIEIKKLAADIKKQDSIFKFLPDFVRKNGLPKWDKVIYKTSSNSKVTESQNSLVSTNSIKTIANSSSYTSNNNNQGVFFIPLQSQNSQEIKSYIIAYKHNDSLYTYRLYNKDSLNAIQAGSAATKNNLLNTQAVFGFFEKSINNVDSVNIKTPVNATIKNVQINFDSPSSASSINSVVRNSMATSSSCTISITVTIEYSLEIWTNGYSALIMETVSVTMEIAVDCSGGGGAGSTTGGGSTGGGSFGDGSSGGGSTGVGGYYDPTGGGYWWNYGSGWPWNTGGSGSYDPNWYWWWTGGGGFGGGSGGSGFSSTVTTLSNQLGLSYTQSLWLEINSLRANELLTYLQTSSNPLSVSISLGHLERMMSDLNYLSFVQQHYINYNSQSVWWENVAFLLPFGGQGFGDWAIQYLIQNPSILFPIFENQFLKISEGIDGSYNSNYWDDPSLTFPPQSLPSWNNFEAAYPKHNDPLYNTSQEMYTSVGGQVFSLYNSNPSLFQNTCALRISKALNYSGISVPAGPDRYQGSDGKYYFVSCAALFNWMKKTFGIPSGSNHLTGTQGGQNGQNFPSLLSSKKGIYIMLPNFPGGCSTGTGFCASGHADIINNSVCDGGCFFGAIGGISDIYVWELQ